jgi:hypothetical protein
MKIFTFLFILIFSANAFALPLVFKASKTIETVEDIDLIEIDTAKYRQLRVGVVYKNQKKEFTRSPDRIWFYAVEDGEDFSIIGEISDGRDNSFTASIDAPPAKIKIQVRGRGLYKVFVWAI